MHEPGISASRIRVQDTVNADRVVIGSYDKRSGDALEDLYRDFYRAKMPPLIRTTSVHS